MDNALDRFRPVLAELETREIPYLLAVVPAAVTPRDYEFLLRLKHAEVALHGWDHVPDRSHRVEFMYDTVFGVQRHLRRGLGVLAPFRPTTYVPPFNQATWPTILALRELEFTHITQGPVPLFTTEGLLTEVTPKVDLYGRSSAIWAALQRSAEITSQDHVALHLTWEVHEREKLRDRWRLPALLDAIEETE